MCPMCFYGQPETYFKTKLLYYRFLPSISLKKPPIKLLSPRKIDTIIFASLQETEIPSGIF